MTSKNYIKDIQMFINEAYSDKEPLQENQIKSKRVFNDYCNEIKQGLDRLEKLEKVIELLKTRVKMLETYHEPKTRYHYLYIGGRIVLLSREEYELLKEVLRNDK